MKPIFRHIGCIMILGVFLSFVTGLDFMLHLCLEGPDHHSHQCPVCHQLTATTQGIIIAVVAEIPPVDTHALGVPSDFRPMARPFDLATAAPRAPPLS